MSNYLSSKPRYEILDGLRGVAAIMVLIYHSRNAIILYGESYDFGGPDFTRVKQIKWAGVGGKPCALLYAPYYPNLDTLEPVFANP